MKDGPHLRPPFSQANASALASCAAYRATAAALLAELPFSLARATAATAPRFPDADRRPWTERSDAGSRSFRRSPFARDVSLDPAGRQCLA
jgi:hypothetical protein